MGPFGTRFITLARAPLEASSASFNESRMGDGIRRLERASLEAALVQGQEAVAREAGVPTMTVNALIPHTDVATALERVHQRQERALRAVRRQEMTVATFAMPDELPTASSASEHLNELANTFSRDKDIATSLRDLSFEVAAWESLMQRCATLLDQDESLARSFRQRRLVRLVATWGTVLAVVALALGGAAVVTLRERERARLEAEQAQRAQQLAAAQRRIDAALALPDPCAPDGLDDDARSVLTDAQRTRLAERSGQCAEQQRQQQQRQRCEALATHVAAAQLTPDDAAAAGPAEATLRRVTARALQASDLAFEAMPCAGTPAEGKLWEQLARLASAGGPNLWGLAESISPRLARELAAPGALHPSTVLAIAFRSEKIATAALKSGRPEDAQRARSLCAFKASLGQAQALSCQKILKP